MLMEMDIDDQFFYQFPDHPALLQAQEAYAQILSGAATARSSDDPVHLSLLPRSPTCSDIVLDNFTANDVGALFLPAQDGTSAGVEQSPVKFGTAGDANAFFACRYDGSACVQSSAFLNIADEQSLAQLRSTTFPAGDGDHAALASAFFSGQNGENMDNKAFLKGMPEANKFFPTSNTASSSTVRPPPGNTCLDTTIGRVLSPPTKIRRRWETVTIDDLDIDPDEVLIVNSILHFGNLMDEGVDASSPSPRDVVLSNIRKMRPGVFILFVMNGS
ncbi:hypothetical protein BAE44_0023593 [Dichanthelium oligosanthes]|uniref:Uncharacterized protein n=1 Tax=Dichanthelium oligosanthes TaxID=888268 RepID=A0A1E5URE9_9POAL|nr:hypothetical protein BAE44_0023593 [Dichanthelium oligosanthes]